MMTAQMAIKLRKSLMDHEGYRRFEANGISDGMFYLWIEQGGLDDDWIIRRYKADVMYFYNQLMDNFTWFKDLNEDRQIILIDMCFMGYKRFLEFKKMLAALADSNFDLAAHEMLNSKWAKQVGKRAEDLAIGMRTGTYNI